MKEKTKKIIAKTVSLCLCGAFVAGAASFAGCAGKRDPDTVYISRWALEWEKPLFEAWTAEFEAQNPDIDVEWEFTPYTAHFDRLRTDLLSGDAADIIFVNNWGWEPYSEIDVFEDLGAVESLSATRSGLLADAQNAFRQGDKVVGIPIGLVSRVPVVGTADFEKADVEIPYDRDTAFTGDEDVRSAWNNTAVALTDVDGNKAMTLTTASGWNGLQFNFAGTGDVGSANDYQNCFAVRVKITAKQPATLTVKLTRWENGIEKNYDLEAGENVIVAYFTDLKGTALSDYILNSLTLGVTYYGTAEFTFDDVEFLRG